MSTSRALDFFRFRSADGTVVAARPPAHSCCMFGQLSSTGLALLGFGSFILICLVSHLTKSSRLGDRSTHIVNPVLAMIKSHSGAVVRFVALCGMTAPVLMLVLWTVASLMRPGYDQLSQYGSELGRSQRDNHEHKLRRHRSSNRRVLNRILHKHPWGKMDSDRFDSVRGLRHRRSCRRSP